MPQNACLCGCGAVTDKSFISGHDQRAAWRLLIDLYGSAANAVTQLAKLRDAAPPTPGSLFTGARGITYSSSAL